MHTSIESLRAATSEGRFVSAFYPAQITCADGFTSDVPDVAFQSEATQQVVSGLWLGKTGDMLLYAPMPDGSYVRFRPRGPWSFTFHAEALAPQTGFLVARVLGVMTRGAS